MITTNIWKKCFKPPTSKWFFSRCLHLHSRVQQKFHLTSCLPQVRKWLNYTMRNSDQIMCINLVLNSIIYTYMSFISMYIHLFKFVYMCIYIYMYVYIHIYIYIYIYIYVCVCMYANVDIYHICMYARKDMMMP